MALLSTARAVGLIGSILTLLIIIPVEGSVLAIIGWVLIIIAVSQVSGITGDRKILNDVLVAALLAIAGIAVFGLVVLGNVLSFLSANGISGFSIFSQPHGAATVFASGIPRDLRGLIIGVVEGLVALWVFLLASSIFLRRGYERIADKLGVRMFSTAALIYLIGAALTIVLVGLVVIFVASILQAYAFFSIPDEVPGTTPRPVPMTVPPPPAQKSGLS